MDSSTTPGITPTRTIALALIAAVALGLAALRFMDGTDRLVVPEGAQAGELTLESCQYPTESGDYAADCGTLVVPETRADPHSRLIALPVTRIRATSDAPKEPVFYLTGGPGHTNMSFEHANRYAHDRDVVLVGYRGVDGSVRLDCPEVSSALKRSTDILSQGFFSAYATAYRACADRLSNAGVDLPSYGLVQQVDDIEAARVALGYDRITLLSESAGTRTAIIYAQRHPDSIHRSALIAVNPPGAFLWDAATTDEQLARYAALCAADASCRARTDDLVATMRRIGADIPDRWLFLPIKHANVRSVSMLGLFETTTKMAPASAPAVIDAWLSAAEGDASGFWFSSVLSDLLLPELFVRGQYAAAAMLDAQAARDYFADGLGDVSNLGRAATASGWGGGRLVDMWPAEPDENEYRHMRTSQVETLVINGELDVSTPPQVAHERLLPFLPHGHEVVLAGFGHSGTFFAEQPEAGSHLINTFYDSGRVDDSLYAPHVVDFTPSMTLGAIAKLVVGVMLALALLAALSLLVMARRVHTHGHIGPKTSVLLRSVHPVLLGMGGWSLGALIILSTMAAVRVDNELAIILSVGLPVGAGIYWAWVDRRSPTTVRTQGMVFALTGALAGAWLGFHTTAAIFGIITAIVGGATGANLLVILFDIARPRRQRHAPAPPDVASQRERALA